MITLGFLGNKELVMLINRKNLAAGLMFANKVGFFWGMLALSAYSHGSCGDVYAEKYGPYDYADEKQRSKMLVTVERRHFTENVKNLKKGGETGSIMGDISYTLKKFPNHYPALMAIVKYSVYEDVKTDPFIQKEINCFFVRAKQFKPSDYRVYHIYGNYLFRRGDYKGSIENYMKSLSIRDSAEVHYNLGLAYLKLEDVKKAEFHARKAYSKKYPLLGLKNMLIERQVSIE
jgi:tetratricopeptide (TPR) repeat protein